MTNKLYYIDAYINRFSSDVISVSPCENGFDVILADTAFFPEEGGQSSDTGYIGKGRVTYVYEKDGIIHHITDSLPDEKRVECSVDFDLRFEKMQCHTAEHILCGIIHREFGYENIGFHLSDYEVVFDIGGILTKEDIDRIETTANEVVFSNKTISTSFPNQDEIKAIEYRSKLDLVSGVRLVTIEDTDVCACCAPHVARTGEIGIIKIIDFMKHRGGTRITMVAGKRALKDYNLRFDNAKRISGMLSTPQYQIADSLEKYMLDSESAKNALKSSRLRIAELEAEKIQPINGSAVFYFKDFKVSELIAFSNKAKYSVSEILVALSGVDGDYKYVISSSSTDLRIKSKEINNALSGRGGGRPEMIQGSFSASLEQIKKYFE